MLLVLAICVLGALWLCWALIREQRHRLRAEAEERAVQNFQLDHALLEEEARRILRRSGLKV